MEKKAAKGKIPTSRAGTWNKGYTLIELSIIMILLGIVLLIAIPKLGLLEDSKLRGTSRKLAGTIQSLFDESVMKKVSYQLVFDITERRYYILEKNPDVETSEVVDLTNKYKMLPEKIIIKDIETELNKKATDGQVTLQFYPDGFMDKSVIHISDGKKDYTLTTTPLTGKVKILEGYVEAYE